MWGDEDFDDVVVASDSDAGGGVEEFGEVDAGVAGAVGDHAHTIGLIRVHSQGFLRTQCYVGDLYSFRALRADS